MVWPAPARGPSIARVRDGGDPPRTVNGLSISITHDTYSPRPYSRINLVQGTEGLVSGWPQMAVSLEIPGNPHPPWEPGDNYRARHASALRTHAKEVHAKLPGIASVPRWQRNSGGPVRLTPRRRGIRSNP